MGFITSKSGDHLLAFRQGNAPSRLEEYPDLPVSFSCVIAKHQEKTLFVFNPWRKEWELPSGGINPGEAPLDAAIRELGEESGQSCGRLKYVGLCLLGLQPDNQLELGAIYVCEIEQVVPFRENDESTKMMFYDLKQPVEEYVNEIGIELVKLVDEIRY